ncbi:MAG: hypothetical protein FWJ65_11205 [Limnochordales bacterium]
MYKAYSKLEVMGNVIRITEYENGVWCGKRLTAQEAETWEQFKRLRAKEQQKSVENEERVKVRKRKEKNRKDSVRRTRKMIKDKVRANFTACDRFVTLTFDPQAAEKLGVDVKNPKECKRVFKRFIQNRLKRWLRKNHPAYVEKFKYLAVVEFQKNGNVHFHMLARLPYIDNKGWTKVGEEGWTEVEGKKRKGKWEKRPWESVWQRELWVQKKGKETIRLGAVDVKNIRRVSDLGNYVVKYLNKSLEAEWCEDVGDIYLCSQGLKVPKVYRDEGEEGERKRRIIQGYGLDRIDPLFQYEYESEWQGKIVVKEYNIRKQGLKYKVVKEKVNECMRPSCFELAPREDVEVYYGLKKQEKSEKKSKCVMI